MTVIVALLVTKLRGSEASRTEKFVWVLVTILEGISRVVLNYHTVGQVIGGTMFGVMYTLVFDELWSRVVEPEVKKHLSGWLSLPPSDQAMD